MAKKTKESEVHLVSDNSEVPRPRLHKLLIRNFRCIGTEAVEIELDDIVVLVGPNNVGKSSVLKAYEIVMMHGSMKGHLTLDDFPGAKIDTENLPQIELQTIVYDDSPGDNWIEKTESGEMLVRERWTWKNPGAPIRQGFDVSKSNWDDKVPWGAPNIAKSRRPEPHRVDAFDTPENQSQEIVKILVSVLNERAKKAKSEKETESAYSKLLGQIKEAQKQIVEDSQAEIEKVQQELSNLVGRVFPGYEVEFDARPEDDLEKTLSLFKTNPQLKIGPKDGYKSPMEWQGSGARRTMLWTALQIVTKAKQEKSAKSDDIKRPHVLLIDEPEICLHPNAIRNACDVLYNLPDSGNWQVMVTTHSPAFIDISRKNTTIIRVEFTESGSVKGTTIFRPDKVNLGKDDRERLKLLNLCDPYVTEFFFGGRTIIVEGDTEYTAFKYVIEKNSDKYDDVHIIRARGKATIVSLVKILNHFGTHFSVLHDSDKPKAYRKDGTEITNPAWTQNTTILDIVEAKPETTKIRLLASIPNFEEAYLQNDVKDEKPYNALVRLKNDSLAFDAIEQLLNALIDHSKPLPNNCIEWSKIDELEKALT